LRCHRLGTNDVDLDLEFDDLDLAAEVILRVRVGQQTSRYLSMASVTTSHADTQTAANHLDSSK